MIASLTQKSQGQSVEREAALRLGGSREVSNESSVEKLEKPGINMPDLPIPPLPPLPPEIWIRCENVGRFAHPDSCEKYYFCYDKYEDHKEFTCPNGKAFSPVNQQCVYNYAVCAKAPKCSTENTKRILSNPNDNTTFFECKLRPSSNTFVLRKRECAEGREFVAELGFCKSKFSDDDVPFDDSDSSEELECEKPGIFTDHTTDYNYYECVVQSVSKGTLKLIRRSCPKYHIFINREKRCVPFLKMP